MTSGILANRAGTVLLLGGALLTLTACPAAVGSGGPGESKLADESDPRVIRSERTGDLYPRDTKALPEEKPDFDNGEGPPPVPTTPGVGRPDETNGVCRLYAPEYPNPECCAQEYGVDAERIKELCGFEVYMGEYFRNGCGYHFKKTPTSKTEWLWAAAIDDAANTDEAVTIHDTFIQRRFKKPDFESKPIPGLAGGYYSEFSNLGWSVVPGWPRVRQFGYSEGFCGDALPQVLGEIAKAKRPPEGAERLALVPKARK